MGEIDPVDVDRLKAIMDVLGDAECLPDKINVKRNRTVELTWQFEDGDREVDDE